MEKKVCIIGGGISGIVSVKSCLEVGLTPACYEESSHIGGLWNRLNDLTVPYCTFTNTSKEMTCFSDFPMPDGYPNFLNPDKVMAYINSYVERHNVMKYCQLDSKVTNVECCESHGNCVCADCVKSHGKYWKVTVLKNGKVEEDFYDSLIVATGFNRVPFIPDTIAEKMKQFDGEIIHSSSYRSWQKYEDKNVVVCGFGNSGGDISVELSRHASKVYLATKHGSYTLRRVLDGGYPFDALFLRRIKNLAPAVLKRMYLPKFCDSYVNHENFGLKPEPTQSSEPNNFIINDEIMTRILTGHVTVKSDVFKTQGNKVIFSDGTFADDIDVIILCTGYKRHFSFIKDDNVFNFPVDGKTIPLYKYIFPQKHVGRVALVGTTGVAGSVFPIYELQARYAAQVFCNSVTLPNEDEIGKRLEKRVAHWKRIGKYVRETAKVNYINYQDELAVEIGVKPCIWKLMFTDPILAYHIMFGPSCPYQYRLQGPGLWSGARDAILTVEKRMWAPFSKRSNHRNKANNDLFYCLFIIFLAIFSIFYVYF